jgi:tetratricopeptide (TPR) repeat protein
LKALNSAESIKDTGRVSALYNNIGSVYQLQENYPRALQYFLKSLAIEQRLNQPLQKSIRYYNIGEVYKELDSLELALNYFNNSLLLERKYKNSDGVIYALLGIADIYVHIERFTDAEISLSEVKGLLKDIYLEENILYHQLKGQLLHAKGDSEGSYQELIIAENLSNQHGFRIHLTDIYSAQIEILIAQGRWQEAVKKQQVYIHLREELNDVRVKNQLEDLSFQNELNKKELEIDLIQEERDLAQKNEAAVKNIANYTRKIVLFLILSLACVLALIIYGIRKITRQNAT